MSAIVANSLGRQPGRMWVRCGGRESVVPELSATSKMFERYCLVGW